MGQGIGYFNRFLGTFLGTQRTSDTTGLAYLHNKRSLVLVHAVNRIFCLVRYEFDKVLGTGLDTLAAGAALIPVDNSDTVDYADRIKLAHTHTGPKTHTSEIA